MTFGVMQVDRAAVERLRSVIRFEGGRQVPLAAAELKGVPQSTLAAFCKFEGLHQIITHELVDFCRDAIGGRRAIEVAAGRSSLGHALGLPQSDSYLVQSRPDVRRFYESVGEYTGPLPAEVERLTANEAVDKYKPQVVVACWLSQHASDSSGSPYGADEVAMLAAIELYILVGNGASHNAKRILTHPLNRDRLRCTHTNHPSLVSRSMTPGHNAIWVFGPPR